MSESNIPEISVIMSIYNEPKDFLKASIDSILNQTYKNFEFIIVNDNPERKFNILFLNDYCKNDHRIKVVNNKLNIGLTKSLNIAFKLAKGDFIARMDADDISLPLRFQKQIDFLKSNSEIGLCGSAIQIIPNKSFFRTGTRYYPREHTKIKGQMLFNNPIVHPTVMFKRTSFIENNLFYNEELRVAQDYDLWYQAVRFIKFYNIDEPLLKYRVSEGQISMGSREKQDATASNIRESLLRSLVDASDDEIFLHNKISGSQCVDDFVELNKLDDWFVKLYNSLCSNELYDKVHLQYTLNLYLQFAYLNSFSGLKRFNYFKTKTFKISRKSLKSSLFFSFRCLVKK